MDASALTGRRRGLLVAVDLAVIAAAATIAVTGVTGRGLRA